MTDPHYINELHSDLRGVKEGWYTIDERGNHATVVIGCTGRRAFPEHNDRDVRDGTVLVSASSGNAEFDGIVAPGQRQRLMHRLSRRFRHIASAPFTRLHDDYYTDRGNLRLSGT